MSGAPVVGSGPLVARTLAESDEQWSRARAAGPVVRTGADDGLWLLTCHDEVAEAFRDWTVFSSERTDPGTAAVTVSRSPIPLMVPLELDPPAWTDARRALSPLFTPAAADALRPRVRSWVDHFLDPVVERGHCDFVTDLAVPVPAAVTMELLGFPESDRIPLASVFHEMSGYPIGHPVREAATLRYADVHAAARREVADRRRHPREDGISALLQFRHDGEPLDDDTVVKMVVQIMGGGVDTTTALTTAAFLHLGRDPAARRRLRADPAAWLSATEEFLRRYPPARTFARTVTADTEIAGCPVPRGDRVVLSIAAANLDGEQFEEPETFRMERSPNRHLAFGVGIHRCPGSHLARVLFVELMTAVVGRMGDYLLDEDGIVAYPNWSALGGWAHVPARFPVPTTG